MSAPCSPGRSAGPGSRGEPAALEAALAPLPSAAAQGCAGGRGTPTARTARCRLGLVGPGRSRASRRTAAGSAGSHRVAAAQGARIPDRRHEAAADSHRRRGATPEAVSSGAVPGTPTSRGRTNVPRPGRRPVSMPPLLLAAAGTSGRRGPASEGVSGAAFGAPASPARANAR